MKVNQAITILGMTPGLNKKRDAMLFSYDIGTLKRLGLNIEFEIQQVQLSSSGQKVVQIIQLTEAELNQLLEIHQQYLISEPL